MPRALVDVQSPQQQLDSWLRRLLDRPLSARLLCGYSCGGVCAMIVHILPWRIWKYMWRHEKRVGLFKNLPGVIPGRWGFWIFGFEFGSRNPGNKFGSWLKYAGLWRW